MSDGSDSPEPEEQGPGQPTKYKAEYCERVVELAKVGASRVEIAFELDVCRNTLDNWCKQYPEFLRAITRARIAEQAWWERKGRENVTSAVFQAGMWSRSMAARFPKDWREVTRQENTGADKGPIEVNVSGSISEVRRRIASSAARIRADGDPE